MQKKFVIYGQSRCGSTLLVELMNGSPNVHCDGELLNHKWGYVRSKKLLKLIARYPFPYFNYMRRRGQRDVYGFKILFYQLSYSRYALNRLQRTGWKFIHVRRRNVVHQAFSKILASKTNHWHRRTGDKDPDYHVDIDLDELECELKRRERWTARELDLINGIDRLDITYEDDLLDKHRWPPTIDKVSSYLGIERFEPDRLDLKPTDHRPYAEVIANYAEVRNYLTKSKYAQFLS